MSHRNARQSNAASLHIGIDVAIYENSIAVMSALEGRLLTANLMVDARLAVWAPPPKALVIKVLLIFASIDFILRHYYQIF